MRKKSDPAPIRHFPGENSSCWGRGGDSPGDSRCICPHLSPPARSFPRRRAVTRLEDLFPAGIWLSLAGAEKSLSPSRSRELHLDERFAAKRRSEPLSRGEMDGNAFLPTTSPLLNASSRAPGRTRRSPEAPTATAFKGIEPRNLWVFCNDIPIALRKVGLLYQVQCLCPPNAVSCLPPALKVLNSTQLGSSPGGGASRLWACPAIAGVISSGCEGAQHPPKPWRNGRFGGKTQGRALDWVTRKA